MSKDFVTVIKREEFNCPRTRTKRTRDGGTYEVAVAEAIKGLEAQTHRAPGHSLGKVPGDWQKSAPKAAVKNEKKQAPEDSE